MATNDNFDLEKNMKNSFEMIKAPSAVKSAAYASCLQAAAQEQNTPRHLKAIYDPPPNEQKRIRQKRLRSVLALVACLTILLCGYGGYSVFATETAYISIDVNPSVELGLNRFHTVISQKSYNADGQAVLQDVSLLHKNYEEALGLLLQSPTFHQYLNTDNTLELVVVTDNATVKTSLFNGVQQCINRHLDRDTVHVVCHSAGTGLREEATHCGMSPGKYQAYLAWSQLDDTVTIEDCHKMSISEINDSIRSFHSQNQVEETTTTDSSVAPPENPPAVQAPQPNQNGQGNQWRHQGQGHHGDHHGN